MPHTYVRPKAKISKIKDELIGGNKQDIFAVVGDDGRYRGFIRASDLLNDKFSADSTAEEVLDDRDNFEHRDVYIYPDTSIAQARKVIDANRISFVPIVDYNGYYVGTLDRSAT